MNRTDTKQDNIVVPYSMLKPGDTFYLERYGRGLNPTPGCNVWIKTETGYVTSGFKHFLDTDYHAPKPDERVVIVPSELILR